MVAKRTVRVAVAGAQTNEWSTIRTRCTRPAAERALRRIPRVDRDLGNAALAIFSVQLPRTTPPRTAHGEPRIHRTMSAPPGHVPYAPRPDGSSAHDGVGAAAAAAAERERQLAETLRARRRRSSPASGQPDTPRSQEHPHDQGRDRSRTHREHDRSPSRRRERDDYRARDYRDRRQVRDRERDRERERERDRERDRELERERDRRSHEARSREPPPPPRWRPMQVLQHEPDADTVERTVFVASLSQQVSSQVLGQFFAQQLGMLEVVDAHIVMDKVTRRPKGVGYVTLATHEATGRALKLNGAVLFGIPVQVSAVPVPLVSTAVGDMPNTAGGGENTAARLYVGSLNFNLDAPAVKQVFSAFGPVEYVDLHREPNGKSKGFAFVQFVDPAHAQAARQHLNGIEVMGRPMRVGHVKPRPMPGGGGGGGGPGRGPGPGSLEATAPSFLDEGGGGRLDADARAALMQNLMYRGAAPQAQAAAQAAAKSAIPPPPPSTAVRLGNMFNAAEETDRNWARDMAQDVEEECAAQYGPVARIYLDAQSDGDIYVRFADAASAQRAVQALDGRHFNGRSIRAASIPEAIFAARVA